MSQINLLLCSRGRPNNLKRLIDSASNTAHDPCSLQFWIRVDDDDSSLMDYSQLTYDLDVYREYIVGKRDGNVRPYNELIKQVFEDKAVIACMIVADDVVFRTSGWDTAIRDLDEIHDIYLAYFKDGKANSICASHPVISKKLAQALDYNCFDHDYQALKADQHLTDVCKKAGVSYFIGDYLVEHLHPKYGTAEWDATYIENRPDWILTKDQATFDSKAELREKQIEMIKRSKW